MPKDGHLMVTSMGESKTLSIWTLQKINSNIVSLFLHSDGNNSNVDDKQFESLKVHWIQLATVTDITK